MMATEVRPYGSWTSPISAEMLTSQATRMVDAWLTEDNALYWIEVRSQEGGRFAVMRLREGEKEPMQVTPAPYSVRTRVHEYGGSPLAIVGETLFFSNYGDHRIYRQRPGEDPQPITAPAKMRYADPIWDSERDRLIAIREDHTTSDIQAVNALVAIDPEAGGTGQVLVQGYDFYLYPRLSQDGRRLAWICWNHPNMPWDGTELWVADVTPEGDVVNAVQVAGGPEESVIQPAWSPEGDLYCVSDRTGWWNLYRVTDGGLEAITDQAVEYGQPNWQIGTMNYAFYGEQILAFYGDKGYDHLVLINPKTRQQAAIDLPYTVMGQICANRYRAVFFAGSPTEPWALVSLDPGTGSTTVIKASSRPLLDVEDISIPEAIEFPTERGRTAHAFFYPPKNHRFAAPEGEKPPLLVFSHGGPTGQTEALYGLGMQYWTTRGFAVVDVNYGGSTGYGREYRNRLYDSWGLLDVEDCTNVALYLAEEGRVDINRLAIRGGSAGGYTTLACLTFRDVFHVGASYFGVSDIGALARETHKFESRYMDKLVGPWPEAESTYQARSPVFHAEKLTSPVIFFQGLDDKVVLPNQAELMVESLRERGIPVAYLPFEGEGHGFVRAENVIRAQEAELYFYAQIMGIDLTERIEPVAIHNWPQR